MGLMQLMPQTFKAMAIRYGLPAEPFSPRENIFAGAAYLHRCYLRFGFPLLFSAYEAGPGRVESFIAHGERLPQQTRNYMLHILHTLAAAPAVLVPRKSATAQALFVAAADGARLFVGGASSPSGRRDQQGVGARRPRP
jgi:hypothetical protein